MTTLNFSSPKIIGEIVAGSKVGLINLGLNGSPTAMLVKAGLNYIWQNIDGLDFAEFTLISSSIDPTLKSLMTSDGKFISILNLPSPGLSVAQFSLTPLKKVDIDKVYAGVSYFTGTTFVMFVPLNLPFYNIVSSGIPNTVDSLNFLQVWSDSTSEPISDTVTLIKNPTGVCLDEGWLNTVSSGCIFLDQEEAENEYFYSYADPGSAGCSSGGLGTCAFPTLTCDFDYNPVLKNNQLYPYSCTPTNPTPVPSGQLIFSSPKIIGEILPGSTVGLINLGFNGSPTGMLIKSGINYIWTNFDGLDFARFTLISSSTNPALKSLKTEDNKFVSILDLPSTGLSSIQFSLEPIEEVNANKVYSGVRYLTGTTIVMFVPLNLNFYNVVNSGVTEIPQSLNFLQIWSNSDQDVISDTVLSIRNPTGVCLNDGWLNSSSSGCIFINSNEADNGYFYRYANSGSTGCNSGGLGVCLLPTLTCDFDYNPDLEANLLYPYSCEPEFPEPPVTETIIFSKPNIVGEIKPGAKVGLIDFGSTTNMLIRTGNDIYEWSNVDGLNFASFELVSLDLALGLKTNSGKYLNIETLQSENIAPLVLNPIEEVLSTKIYAGVTYIIGTRNIMFVPLDLPLYNVIINGVSSNTLPINLLQIWSNSNFGTVSAAVTAIRNPSGACANNGWINNSSSGCIFVDPVQQKNGYFYRYAVDGSIGCDSGGFGLCTPPTKECAFDHDSILEINQLYPYTCDPSVPVDPDPDPDPDPEPSTGLSTGVIFIIVIIILVVLIIVGVVAYLLYRNSKKSKNKIK